jgi:hypothetical protein
MHALTGWGAVAMASCHELAVLHVAAGRGRTWLATELAIGLFVIVPGAVIAWSARRWPRRHVAGLAATTTLLAVSLAQLVHWLAAFPALFAMLATLDGIGLSATMPRSWLTRSLLTLFFVIVAVLLAAAFMQSMAVPVP